MESINFDKLLGEEASLYYCNDSYTFQLGTVKFEVVEDEQDGYRSSLKDVFIVDRSAKRTELLANIVIRNSSEIDEGYDLVDTEDDHVWITFGTDHADDYYPCFIFRFNARPDKSIDDLKLLLR